jgi:DNA-binding response OmpR family regulator
METEASMNRMPKMAAANNPRMGAPSRVLVIDADAALSHVIADALAQAGLEPVCCADPRQALAWLEGNAAQAVLLDLAPHAASCLEVIDAIRKPPSSEMPVLVMSSIDALEIRIHALNRGADDYLLKPFGAQELLARLATALRRREIRQERYLRLGGMLVDMETARFGDGINWTWLTPKEWRVFAALLARSDQMVSRQHLKQVAAGSEQMSDNALEAMICRLRAKAADLGVSIRALRGVGYMLEPQHAAAEAVPAA